MLWSAPCGARGTVSVALADEPYSQIFSLLYFCIQTSFRQIIFTVVSITLNSIRQKCKTNIESSVSYSSAFPSREGLFCNLLDCLCLTLNFKHSERWLHKHTRARTHTQEACISFHIAIRMYIHVSYQFTFIEQMYTNATCPWLRQPTVSVLWTQTKKPRK